jgi:hypothetical protein
MPLVRNTEIGFGVAFFLSPLALAPLGSEFHIGQQVTLIDHVNKVARTQDGQEYPFDICVVSRPSLFASSSG